MNNTKIGYDGYKKRINQLEELIDVLKKAEQFTLAEGKGSVWFKLNQTSFMYNILMNAWVNLDCHEEVSLEEVFEASPLEQKKSIIFNINIFEGSGGFFHEH